MNKKAVNFSDLERAILKTLSFFDIFDYPLTAVEIHKWQYRPAAVYQLSEIIAALNEKNLAQEIAGKNGFYFLTGRENIIAARLSRYQIAEKKFQIALKAAAWLRFLAFVEMIAICNNTNYNNASPESDIDFFIVIRRGRLWWGRLIVTLLISLLGVRRHDKKIANRICLSFYAADSHLNLADIALTSGDIYLTYWLATLAPIYGQSVSQKFFSANGWLKNYLPNFYPPILTSRRRVADKSYHRFVKKINQAILGGRLGDALEAAAKFFQRQKMKPAASLVNTNVVISDVMLKFHENDRRQAYQLLWERKISEY